MERIYVDHAATSPMHPEVIEKMVVEMQETFGNPSSIHSFGRQARQKIDAARMICANSIGAKVNEIIFTSGGTESDNFAVRGAAYANQKYGKHIITSSIEHHAILHTCNALEKEGFEVTYLPVDHTGRVNVADVKAALRDDTILVSIMMVNNEIGTVQPIKEIGELLKDHRAHFHTDAVQAYGLIPINVEELGVDFLSISSHKINGPKGVGFLYISENAIFTQLQFGGQQERKRRAGTENVPGIVGLAKAVELIQIEREERVKSYLRFREILISVLNENGVRFEKNGNETFFAPHVLNLSFEDISIESFLVNLDLSGIAASSGSACTAGSIDPSHVLVEMFGIDSPKIQSSIRFSFGYGNTDEQIRILGERVSSIVKRLVKI
ncbi:cysteine desulfurase family protein [Bacillus sp. AFS041924]|uniref:cysteine desulfurase family protein n=1 Tax=Bacillus sp. AFS041924 TaxID=2033503 RepID=UPI000BFD4D6B|nr:cysteine desulfurase family protein [Bacillus sp. AFS041924]PGS50033.1 cysteine desulfurase NifS [Bacillus sp. AFS041924]